MILFIPPTTIHWNFRLLKFSETQKATSTNCFNNVRQKISRQKPDSPSYPKKDRFQKLPETPGSPYENIRYRGEKSFGKKSWYPPPFLREKFGNMKVPAAHNGPLTKFFGSVTQKIFRGIPWYPPSSSKKRNEILLETQKVSPMNNFGTVRQRKSTENSTTTPPPILSITFFDDWTFLKHRRFLWKMFFALWDKKKLR